MSDEKLAEGWVKFLLERGYDVFGTQTFGDKEHGKVGRALSADNAIDRTKRVLKLGCKRVKIPLNAFVVAEEHSLGTWHTHWALRSGAMSQEHVNQVCQVFKDIGDDIYGWSRSSPVKRTEAVTAYVSKYLTKKVCEYEVLGR